ncbi:type IX secretion system sortase PorU [Parabacteroides sp. FAFU027]|uniref:type IX secretion system sortase PorU n=1 Tax=Parabacteroides sp. FAFU027 TaxID=2922715 RepID=UPI001FAFF1CF|nr:type IX secretion system sortase PorU [Parabacteroides sp. FAFU027]
MSIRNFLIIILLAITSVTSSLFAGNYTYADNSLLASGKWAKIKLTNSGVYKLTYSDLRSMGFSDPTKVRVYGFGGAMLKEQFNYPKADTKTTGDLPEVPVYKGTDFILFWAQGVISWTNSGSGFTHTINPYSSYAYYFLTDSQGTPSTIQSVASLSDTPDATYTTFNDYALHEVDLTNIGATGREFYGEDFSATTSQTFPFTISGVTTITPISANIDFVSKAAASTTLKLSINNTVVINTTMPGPATGADEHYIRAKEVYATGSYSNTSADNSSYSCKVDYGKSGDSNCKLNYIRLNMERNLKLYDTYTPFRVIASKGKIAKYTLAGANANVQIWDVTTGKIKQVLSSLEGTQLSFTAKSPADTIREFVAVDVNATFPKPELVGTVTNQNLHALTQTDMVIICHPDFLNQAEKIAQMHRDKDNFRVTIAQPEQIYNEFSSGTPDASAYRWFLKMFYDRATSDTDKPKYLLLFGDGTYDNRLLGTEWKTATPANKLLTYQSVKSLVETDSYVCDDYFGFLDDNEGANIAYEKMDLGIGRFPVRTADEATDVVNKILNYVNNNVEGAWKNNVCFVGDDDDNNEHMKNANYLTQYLEDSNKSIIVNKIFLDSYKKEFTSTGSSYPNAKKQLFSLLNSGLMVLNYTGHGGVNGWATEQIITKSEIIGLTMKKLPLWVTATCDFSRFDDFNTTAGEEVFLNSQGGGIGLITTTRVVYSGPNFSLNSAVNKLLFSKNSDGSRLRLGDIMKTTKSSLNGDQNKLNFTLLGDPALKLSYPESKMEITAINDKPASEQQTLSALSEVKVTGRVLQTDGAFDSSFNGIVIPTVFDSQDSVTCLNNNGFAETFKYMDRTKILFAGKDSVKNGLFTFRFTIPKDMSYSGKSGRINLYAANTNGNEAQGYYENFLLNGTNPNATIDTIGPKISEIYLNNSDFKTGDIVNEKPVLIADLTDESGINVSGTGIGHDMTLIVDNQPSLSYNINGYFSTTPGDSKSGKLYYNIPTLSEGKHTLVFKAWDIQNNSTSDTIECIVKAGAAPRLFDLYPTKNPIKISDGGVSFYLKHDRPNTNISVKMSVYNLSGIEVWAHSETGLSDMFLPTPITWDLKQSNGQTVRPGIYIYRATIYTNQTQETTQAKKLIILGQ